MTVKARKRCLRRPRSLLPLSQMWPWTGAPALVSCTSVSTFFCVTVDRLFRECFQILALVERDYTVGFLSSRDRLSIRSDVCFESVRFRVFRRICKSAQNTGPKLCPKQHAVRPSSNAIEITTRCCSCLWFANLTLYAQCITWPAWCGCNVV